MTSSSTIGYVDARPAPTKWSRGMVVFSALLAPRYFRPR
jgi:hypothetical protein